MARECPVLIDCLGETLVGILHPAAATSVRFGILVVVGGPQYRVGSHRQFVQMARELAAAGYPVLRFDYRGMGDSAAPAQGFERVEPDIRAAIDRFSAEIPTLEGVIVFGLCDAAAAALMYCLVDARVAGLILANPWVRTAAGEAASFVKHYYGRRLLQVSFWRKLLAGELRVAAAVKDFLGKLTRMRAAPAGKTTSFIERMLLGLQRFRGRVLILISERDLTAQEFQDLCRTSNDWKVALARPNIHALELTQADHTFSSETAARSAAAAMLSWLSADGTLGTATRDVAIAMRANAS